MPTTPPTGSSRGRRAPATDVETYVYDGLGRLITAEKGTGSNGDAVSRSAFTYDSLSRVNEECQSITEGSDDVAIFVGEVIAAVPNPQLSCIFDRNGDGTVNGLDIQPFVDDPLAGP